MTTRSTLRRAVLLTPLLGLGLAGCGPHGSPVTVGRLPTSPLHTPAATTTAASEPVSSGPVIASARDIYYGAGLGQRVSETGLDQLPWALYLTSAGVVVRSIAGRPADQPQGVQYYDLLTADGRLERLSQVTQDVVVSADPDQPYLAYAQFSQDEVQVVIYDVRRQYAMAVVSIPGHINWPGSDDPADPIPAPAVSLSGDHVFVAGTNAVLDANWRTDEVAPSTVLDPATPAVHGGRAVLRSAGSAAVVDATSGDVLFRVSVEDADVVSLSPDGRYARIDAGQRFTPDGDVRVYDIATGAHVSLPGEASAGGWTSTDEIYWLDRSQLSVCHPVDGTCSTSDTSADSYGGAIPVDDPYVAGPPS